MTINCIIIEDEPLAQEKLTDFISQVPLLCLDATFRSAIEAMEYINSNRVDLIFLDINMPKLNGIEFLESLKEIPSIIIVSAYSQYALKGYEFSVVDYLLKPFSFERFIQAINKVLELQKNKLNTQNQPDNSSDNVLFVKTGNRIEKIELNSIFFVQGMKDYQMIVSEKHKTMTLQSFTEITKVLTEPQFVRIHKSFIVAIPKIESIEKNRIKINGQLLPVSNTYKEHFFDVIKNNKHLL